MQFELVQNVKIVFGAGKLSELGELVKLENSSRPLVVTDKGIVAAGIAGKVLDVLKNAGLEPVLFDGVQPDPSTAVVAAAWETYTAQSCDLVIGLGGGSAMDTGKAVNILRYNEGPIIRFAKGEEMKAAPGLVVVPTTSGTGSELSDGLVITGDDGVKYPILATLASSEYAVVDPELMVGMPPHITASTGFDTLAHGVESYTGTAATLLSDQISKRVMEMVTRWLPVAVADGSNIEARSNMAAACLMGGWMLRYGHTHAGHSLAHVIGAHFHIPHGFACAYALPYVIEFNAPAAPEKTRRVAKQFGALLTGNETPEELGAKARNALISFRDVDLHLKGPKEWNIDRSLFPQMAKEISQELFQAFNPRKMTEEDALALLEKIFA
ncbi:iron-containing alcohol dehydrogenase [Pseudoflavonifractor sp.]|jgi:alcohol dehydrogenase class IV|uniref:iron-containing alcohol dehydrogenase n=1 Tax=Pseudoflavonifractor sp. TaxID=1980281 RepID=UPI003D8B2033